MYGSKIPELIILEAGAMGYIRHDTSEAEVVFDTLYAIYEGERRFLDNWRGVNGAHARVVGAAKTTLGRPSRQTGSGDARTNDRTNDLELIRNGASNQDIPAN